MSHDQPNPRNKEKTKQEHLQLLTKFKQLRDNLIKGESKLPREEKFIPTTLTPQSIGINIRQYDTKDVHTLFRTVQEYPSYIPSFVSHEFTRCEPLFHPVRAKKLHKWLEGLGTSKYLDIIEEVAINMKRGEEIAQGFFPLTLACNKPWNVLELVEAERKGKCCPLYHFRDLGNGFYVLVNVNDMIPYGLDSNPLPF